MKDNFGYVIIGLIIIAGCIFIGLTQVEEKEEYNLALTINGVKYEAIIYTNNKVIVGHQNCMSSNCFIETKTYNYSKDKMNEFRTKLKTYNFEEYDYEKEYDSYIYIVETNKILNDFNYDLNSIINKIILGNY